MTTAICRVKVSLHPLLVATSLDVLCDLVYVKNVSTVDFFTVEPSVMKVRFS